MPAADERWCANHPVECAEKKAREAREEAIRNEARMQAEQMARDDAQRAERRDRDDAQRLVDDMQRNISSGHSRDQLRSDLSMATQSGGPKTQDVERQIAWDLTVSPSPSEVPAPQESVLPQNNDLGAPNVTLSPEAITNFESYPPKVQSYLLGRSNSPRAISITNMAPPTRRMVGWIVPGLFTTCSIKTASPPTYLMTPRTNTFGFVAQAPSSPWSVVRTIPSSSRS